MKLSLTNLGKGSLAIGAVVVIATASVTLADRVIGGCWRNVECLDVWDPVICDDGQVYSNSCYAYRACATGCRPWGGDISR